MSRGRVVSRPEAAKRGQQMNDYVVDVLIYLYENYMGGEETPPPDQGELHDELAEAGFPREEIEKAFQWLDELADQQRTPSLLAPRRWSFRRCGWRWPGAWRPDPAISQRETPTVQAFRRRTVPGPECRSRPWIRLRPPDGCGWFLCTGAPLRWRP